MVEKKKKNLLKVILIFFIILLSFSYLYVKAFLNSDTSQIVPPDSFIQSGNVITIIEEDEKYYRKVETFNDDGSYSSPAMETQITYDEYAQIRSNSEYDILEKRNRHIINDIYVDEYYKAYSNGEIMAGNYVAEVLDGYFVPVEFNEHKSLQRVLINDGGVFYLATFNYDSEGNYAGPAMYLLISEDDYNSILIDEDYDYVKDVQWEISYDGNTIIKTISYYDKNDDLIMRPIVLQLTGFDSLEEYLNPNNIPNADENKPEENPNGDNGNNSEKNNGGGNGGSQSETQPEPPWTGTTVETKDDPIEWQGLAEWVDEANDDKLTGEGIDGQENQIIEGFYDDAGNFIEVDNNGNITPSEPGHFDENSNFIPEGGEGYYDSDGIWHPSDETEGKYDENGNFEINGEKIDPEGNIIPDENIISDENGHYDENGNFIENKGNIIDKDGIIHKDGSDIEILDTNGRRYINPEGLLTLDFYGRIVAFGKEGYYDEHGLIHLDNGTVGYYNADGKFTESRQNPYNNEESKDKGFYDVTGEFHSFNTIYKTENDTTNLVLYPDIQLETDGLFIKIPDSSYQYSDSGLINNNGKKGYFNQLGDFIKSDKSAFKGGFYDEFGRWIDDSLYRLNAKNEIELSLPYFDSYGLFISPNKDRGYFNEQGKFIINKENPYEDGYYRWNTKQTKFGEIYLDSIGNIHKTGSDEVITSTGQVTKAESRKGILDKNKNWFNSGITITPDSKIGHYNEFKEFKEGQIPYLYGYYDSNGYFYRYDGLIISPDGKVGYYDENGNWVDGVKNATLDENGNWILPNGTVVLPDGTIGYYDENGVFHEGENPYTEKTIPFGAQIDENGNIIMPDGTVINGDGIEGYYDENGVWHEGTNPYTDGYYDSEGNFHSYKEEGTLDSNGNIVLSDGTIVSKNGEIGYYDENGVFHEGENPYENGYYDENGVWHSYDEQGTIDKNGNIIMPDGTVIKDGIEGYYDENGVWHAYNNEQGTIDENGNIIMPDGTVINGDGIEGYYDENGVFHEGENPYTDGYYDSEGNFHSYKEEGTLDSNGNIILSDGTVVNKDGVKGYYDENGVFHEGENPYTNGYYDENGVWHDNTENPYEGGYYDSEGIWHSYEEEGTLDSNGNIILSDGTVVNKDGVKGYYDENGVFHEGENPYENGYYDENGIWHSLGEENIKGYYDSEGNWQEQTLEGYIDKNGNKVLPNGVIVSKDGAIGYYDENGVFHEGENPYENGYYDENGVWHSYDSELPEGAYFDEKGNLIMSDGTVISKDGEVGYYDKNGVFHEGENPYENGYYDENGVWHESGYYDAEGNYIMSDGTIVMPDGTVILPDGTVVSGYVDENGKLIITENLNGDSYYDEKGNLIKGINPDMIGHYDADGNYYVNGDTGFYDESGTYHNADGTIGYYDENGVWHEGETNPYVNGFYDSEGNWHGNSTLENVQGYYDENGVFHEGENPYTDGYYDENGIWHNSTELGTIDENGNIVMPNGTVFKDGEAGYYDENGVWHKGTNPYEDGYYDSEGNWHSYDSELPEGAYFDKNGNLIMPDGTIIDKNGKVIGMMGEVSYPTDTPLVGYYDENGNFITGVANPYEGGYYDSEGNWHSDDGSTWIDKNGNVHKQDEGIGYYDSDGNFHLNGDTGYYDSKGTYHNADGTIGYYDKDGVWHEGETNPYAGGYYDSEGNWHPEGDTGYFDKDGNWHDNVSDTTIGYYDENGVFHEGINPYTNGYYDENGVWHGEGEPQKAYYNEKGELIQGTSPYEGGYYDSEGNWHPLNEEGFYDKNGTFHGKDGSIGYYDADGIWHEGTNPYEGGYYDSEGNWHPLGDTGYYDVNGTYYNSDGTFGYYDADGIWHEGQENPYTDGWYDSEGNFHPYGEDGYYDKDGVWHDILLKNSKYEYGNSQYILFTGTWRTSTENAALRLAGNTVQFTVNKHAINKLYSDTGIYVALNSILEYEEAKDIIHNIAITTGNTFIQDTNSCAIIYNERLIPIRKDEKISVKTLQKLFENTNIDITVAKTRIGKKYVLVEAIESNQKIKLKFDDLIITPKHPLTVINNEAYVSLTDVSDIIFYDFALKPSGKERKITFTLKKTIPYEDLRNHFANKIIMTTEDGTINYSGKNTQTKIEILQDICPTVITLDNNSKATYIPIKLIPRLTGCDASFETETYTINFNYNEGIPFMKKYYDLSNELNSEKPIELEETNIGRVQSEMDNKKTSVDKNTVKNNNVE